MERTYLLTGIFVFGVDWLLITGTEILLGRPVGWLRKLLAAVLGGIYGWLSMHSGLTFLGREFWWFLMTVAAGGIAFDLDWRQMAVFAGVKLGFLGLMSGSAWGALLCVCVVGVILALRHHNPSKDRIRVCVPTENGAVELTALCDTGNMLRDPVSGRSVLVVSAALSDRLAGLKQHQLATPLQTVMKRPGLRLIPYHTVGNGGFLLAKKFEKVTVGGKTQDVLIAFSPNEIGGRGFEALTGGVAA